MRSSGTERPSALPQLDNARNAVLELSGVSAYIGTRYEGLTPESKVDAFVGEATTHVDGQFTRELIPPTLGLSKQEADAFFAKPENQPFTSDFPFAENLSERQLQYQAIGGYLVESYKTLRDLSLSNPTDTTLRDQAKGAKGGAMGFYFFSLNDLFLQRKLALRDRFYGIAPESRDTGGFIPTPEINNAIDTAINTVAVTSGREKAEIQDAYTHAIGDASPEYFTLFLKQYDGDQAVRDVLMAVLEARASDASLTRDYLALAIEARKYQESLGIDPELLYELLDKPSGTELDTLLQTQRAAYENTLHAYATTEISEPVKQPDAWSIYQRVARRKQSPKEFFGVPQNMESIIDTLAGLEPLLGELITPSVHITTSGVGNPRPASLTYTNRAGEDVTLESIPGRFVIEEQIEAIAHERTHDALNNETGGANEGQLPVAEFFTQLVEYQVGKLVRKIDQNTSNDYAGATALKEYEHTVTGQVGRTVSDILSHLIEKGTIEDDDIDYIVAAIAKTTNGSFTQPGLSLITMYDPTFPFDGIVYVDSAGSATTQEDLPKRTEVDEAFTKTYGKNWILHPKAQDALREMMRNSNTPGSLNLYKEIIEKHPAPLHDTTLDLAAD